MRDFHPAPTSRTRTRTALVLALAVVFTTISPVDATQTDPAHVDVLFIGAHPDDEYQSLATFGQWEEDEGLTVAVGTITRGEGGGNAAGPEEGPELGLLREAEERRAVAVAGVRDVYYLDKPDFWYTLSAPLTRSVWDGERADTLERLVRLIRATTPSTVVTMEPRPFNQHGAHQMAALLAIEAFSLAADPLAHPRQLTWEGYRPHRARRLLAQDWRFTGPVGPGCHRQRLVDRVTRLPKEGYWEGVWSAQHRTSWAQLERDAARMYVTQGFDKMLSTTVGTPAEQLPCDWYTVLVEDGDRVPGVVRPQGDLRPAYAEFRDWAQRVGMPWLANDAQPDYPARLATTVPEAKREPIVDGHRDDGYTAEPLGLADWEGKPCLVADCSAAAYLAWHGDSLYALVEVTDDHPGAALDPDDCKRHWRTDAVEIALDPTGRSDDTSTTYKLAVMPYMTNKKPCAARDADQHQGPATDTTPGARWATTLADDGYTVEVAIPFADLPETVDPEGLTVNVMLYDADNPAEKVGKSRLAWATFGSAQADPYVWGHARLTGYSPKPQSSAPPIIPTVATQSRDSDLSLEQYARTGVPLGVGPRERWELPAAPRCTTSGADCEGRR
ncbi:sugar-binding protein [Saccharothrix variisporea]|uniref:GlcNAc-PI de-N-acetylase n=1 Tax=Saccharothrix variisporea TaxID=543527 RepID=A0A495XNR2_9PSEU|nr:sugar-binding protein [Saccharothrix variisporea]RKT74544.1 GlcNAc-PI de-N-acetylase [Saccharothrix variisporea]